VTLYSRDFVVLTPVRIMGRLQRLELENFKSYFGKQVVGPFDNFTCIIGPNGAGKSNMMDAISFVLGVQSKHLRSSHLKELVFRKDADSAPARKASVKLVYELSKDEIKDHAAGSEISFCRTISAAGVSSYRLDNKDVTYEKYEDTLQKIGVLVKARNFLVFQGDVEAIASKSPQDLTKLLEQISGSDQFIAEYDDLLRRKAEAEENTIFSMQKKKMYSTQCREVKGQKDEAEYYQDKKEELSNLRTEYVLWQIWCVKSEIEGKQDLADELREQLEVVRSNELELEAAMEEEKVEFAKASKKAAAAEKDVATASKQLDAATPKLAEVRAKLKSLQKRVMEQHKNKGKVQQDLDQQQETIRGLQGDIADLNVAAEDLKDRLEAAAESGLKMDASSLQEYSRLREEVSARIAAQRADELTLDLGLKSKQELMKRLQAQSEAHDAEDEACDKVISECVAREAALLEAVSACAAETATLMTTRENIGALLVYL
jgi:structural maintenance of chromosome 1